MNILNLALRLNTKMVLYNPRVNARERFASLISQTWTWKVIYSHMLNNITWGMKSVLAAFQMLQYMQIQFSHFRLSKYMHVWRNFVRFKKFEYCLICTVYWFWNLWRFQQYSLCDRITLGFPWNFCAPLQSAGHTHSFLKYRKGNVIAYIDTSSHSLMQL